MPHLLAGAHLWSFLPAAGARFDTEHVVLLCRQLSDEKSKRSLADIYEEQFLKDTGPAEFFSGDRAHMLSLFPGNTQPREKTTHQCN